MTVTIATIVEGHGEVQALPGLLRRLGGEIDAGVYWHSLRPIRVSEATIKVQHAALARYVTLAAEQVRAEAPGFVLILTDADDEEDCPARLGPAIGASARAIRGDVGISVVLAKREFEGWFLAAAESLRGARGLPADLAPPNDPEAIRDAKGWLGRHMGRGYEPTRDQPAFVELFDLHLARQRSPSFDKLWREVESQYRTLLADGR